MAQRLRSAAKTRVLTLALSLILYPRLRHAPWIENLCQFVISKYFFLLRQLSDGLAARHRPLR